MHKHNAKQILSSLGIPVLPGILLDQREWNAEKADEIAGDLIEKMALPVMVKPCNLGSSIAVSSAHSLDQLMVSLAGAFVFDREVIVEPFLQDMYELNVSVLDGDLPRLSAIERPRREEELLTFEQKYLKGNKKMSSSRSEGMASLPRDLNPSDVPDSILEQTRSYALKAFRGLDCRGLVRFDFLINAKDGSVYFNEVNPLPGSFSYYLWEAAEPKLPFTELLAELIRLAQEEKKAKQRVRRIMERRLFKEG